MDVTILGAGAMGSALAIPLDDNDHSVTLWGSRFDEEILETIRNGKEHPRINHKLPERLEILGPNELEKAVKQSKLIVLGVSSNGVVPVTERIASFLREDQHLISIAKGLIEYESEPFLIPEGIRKVLADREATIPSIVSVGGPSIAAELANRSRTAVSFASESNELLGELVDVFSTDYYTINPTTDVTGLGTCIGFKNAYSIALAWPNGLVESRYVEEGMTNFRAILFLQTLDELSILSEAFGGRKETVYDLAGLGDLVTTTASGRNGTFGKLLGSGETVEEALQEMEDRGVGVIEGYETADVGAELIKRHNLKTSLSMDDVPLLREINNVLYDGKPVVDAIDEINF